MTRVYPGELILLFHLDTGKLLRSHKMTKSSYLTQMTSNQRNEGTLFSSTLKVEENKVLLFDVNLVRYGDFEFSPISPFLAPFLKF